MSVHHRTIQINHQPDATISHPTRVMASSFLRFLYHTQRRITVGRTPLDEWSARRRDLYLTIHNTHNRQTPMSPVGLEPTISAGERPQTYSLDHAAIGIGIYIYIYIYIYISANNGSEKLWTKNTRLPWQLMSSVSHAHTHTTHTHTRTHTHTHDLSRRVVADLRLRPRGHWNRQHLRPWLTKTSDNINNTTFTEVLSYAISSMYLIRSRRVHKVPLKGNFIQLNSTKLKFKCVSIEIWVLAVNPISISGALNGNVRTVLSFTKTILIIFTSSRCKERRALLKRSGDQGAVSKRTLLAPRPHKGWHI
jgi:hypothetical protein